VGGVLVNPTSLNATATRAGTYTLTVINTVTGCESKDQIVVTLEGDIPTDLNLNVLSPQCVGDPPGSAQVVSVVGGTPPYVYAFNGAPPSATSNWSNPIAGDYTVVVTDDLGCKYETTFSIGTANDIAGTLAGDAIVELGDPAMFSYDLSIGIADSTVWFVNGTPVCFDCDSTFVFTPTGRSQVEVVIYDDRGCELILSAFVQVKVTRNVYIPNVFSPNGDGTNDYFTIFASSSVVEKIEYMQIFSRWGEKVFETTSIHPSVDSEGWDGTFAGELLNPGVYVYHAKVIYVDGVGEIFKGDITLLR
jgi:gliding motility-associated-like protein